MSDNVKVNIDTATREQLFYFARSILNIEVGEGANNATLRAKIKQASPGIEEIMAPAVTAIPATEKPAAEEPAKGGARKLTTHFRDDPKVKIMIHESADPARAKEVQVAVQGDVIIMRRGKKVEIPYRHYLALNDAKEQVARDTDEINPVTGLPFKEWVEQHSYPFNTLSMPSAEEISAWEARTAPMQLS